MIRLLLTLVIIALFTSAAQAQDTGTYVEIERIGRGVIEEMFWSPDGATIAVTTSRGIWFYQTDDLSLPPRWIERNETPLVAFDPAWETMAIAEEGGISLYSIATGERFRQLKAGYTVYESLTFNTTGSRLAGVVDSDFAPARESGSDEGESFIHMWSILSQEVYEMSEGANMLRVYFNPELLPPRALAFSPDGKQLAASAYDEGGDYGLWQFFLLDLESGEVLTTSDRRGELSNDFTLEEARIFAAPYALRDVVVFDPEPERFGIVFIRQDANFRVLDISPDAQKILVEQVGRVLIQDMETGNTIAPVPMGFEVNTKFSPDSSRIAVVNGGRLGIYDIASLSDDEQGCGLGSLSPIATSCLTYTDEHRSPRLGDLEPSLNSSQRTLKRGESISPDSKWLVSGYWQEELNRVYLVRLADEEAFRLEIDEEYPSVIETRFNADSSLAALAFTSTAHGGSYDHYVRVWNLEGDSPDLQPIAKLEHPSMLWTLIFSPDGRRLATSSARSVFVWDTATWELIATLPHPRPVYSLTFSVDSTILTTAASDGVIRLWRG